MPGNVEKNVARRHDWRRGMERITTQRYMPAIAQQKKPDLSILENLCEQSLIIQNLKEAQ
jgi:hypothetical protein